MPSLKCILIWSFTWALWALGALFLWKMWQFQKSLPDPIGSYVEFMLMFVMTFYVLVLIPIKWAINMFFCDSADELSDPIPEFLKNGTLFPAIQEGRTVLPGVQGEVG